MSAKEENSLFSSSSAITNGLVGLGCGVAYGITSPLVGHPIDTIKTKMQAQQVWVFVCGTIVFRIARLSFSIMKISCKY